MIAEGFSGVMIVLARPHLIQRMKRISSSFMAGLFFCLTLSLLLLQACNDAPSDVGSEVLLDTLNARTISSLDSNIIQSAEQKVLRAYYFNQGSLFVGQSSSTRASSLCRVSIGDTIAWLTPAMIDSAVMLIRPRNFVLGSGGSDSTLAFNVVELSKSFMEGSTSPVATWTDLFSSGLNPNPTYFASASKPMAGFKGTIPLGTNVDLSLPLTNEGKSVVARWLSKADTSVIGFGLVPLPESRVIQNFSTKSSSADTMPYVRIKVFYHDNLSVRDSATIQSGNDVCYIDSDTLQSPLMLVQPTLASTAHFVIDVRSIPLTDAILKAQFSFTVDTTLSQQGSSGTDALVFIPSYQTKDSAGKTVENSIFIYGVSLQATRAPGSSTYVCKNIGPYLDYVRRVNGGLLTLDIQSAGSLLERHAVYNLKASADKRPVLQVTYAVRPVIGVRK